MKFHETTKALAPMTLKLLQAALETTVLVASTAYVPRATKQRAERFVQSCVSRMPPFTQALINDDPRNLELNLPSMLYKQNLPGYPAIQERLGNIKAEVSMVKSVRDYLQKNEQYLAARATHVMESLGRLRIWALERQLLKIYADATWS